MMNNQIYRSNKYGVHQVSLNLVFFYSASNQFHSIHHIKPCLVCLWVEFYLVFTRHHPIYGSFLTVFNARFRLRYSICALITPPSHLFDHTFLFTCIHLYDLRRVKDMLACFFRFSNRATNTAAHCTRLLSCTDSWMHARSNDDEGTRDELYHNTSLRKQLLVGKKKHNEEQTILSGSRVPLASVLEIFSPPPLHPQPIRLRLRLCLRPFSHTLIIAEILLVPFSFTTTTATALITVTITAAATA